MLRAGASRQRLSRTLNAAYAEGLMSEHTFSHRLDQLFGSWLVDPIRLVGDLNRRTSRRASRATIVDALVAIWRTVRSRLSRSLGQRSTLLALDWTGAHRELVVGRHPDCDVVVANRWVSRRHARLFFRDGIWVLQDLGSTNGTTVNGERVGRCELRPGDILALGAQHLKID
jgi:FHA domain-containing protein